MEFLRFIHLTCLLEAIYCHFPIWALRYEQDRKLSDARRDTWAHTSPCATTAPSLRMVLKEEGDRIRIRKSNSKNLSAKPCSQPKTPAPICVVVHSLHWMIHQ